MKVTVARKGRTTEERELLFQHTTMEQELIRQGQKSSLPIYLNLARMLRQEIPENYLAELSLSELVENLRQAGDFLIENPEGIKVSLQPQKEAGHYYLFTNSPDANHIFFSLQEYLHRKSLHFRVICHPMFTAERENGKLITVGDRQSDLPRESFVWMELERLPHRLLDELQDGITTLIAAAVQIYNDRPAILNQIDALNRIEGLNQYSDMYSWLCEDNFIPVATRQYVYPYGGDIDQFIEDKDKALGLNQFYSQAFYKSIESAPLTADRVFPLLGHDKSVDLEKTELRCPLHRFERLTYLGFREELSDGRFREHCFWGFYTQKSIDETSFSIPSLRRKIETAQERLCIPHDSHNHRKTIQIVNSFPKIEMFLMDDAELERMLRSFTQMHRQAGVKVVIAPSASECGLTFLLIMPNEYYLPEHIERMETYLRRYLKATTVESRLIHMASDYLSLHVNLQLNRKEVQVDLMQLEQGLTRIAMPWKLKFRELLEKHFAEDSFETWERYSKAFNKDYRSRTHPRFAVRDVSNIEQLLRDQKDAFDL
jgi:glutamate dehydrogenase